MLVTNNFHFYLTCPYGSWDSPQQAQSYFQLNLTWWWYSSSSSGWIFSCTLTPATSLLLNTLLSSVAPQMLTNQMHVMEEDPWNDIYTVLKLHSQYFPENILVFVLQHGSLQSSWKLKESDTVVVSSKQSRGSHVSQVNKYSALTHYIWNSDIMQVINMAIIKIMIGTLNSPLQKF